MTVHDPDLLRRMVDLERGDAIKDFAEDIANGLEMMNGNETYRRAWRIAADWIRAYRYETVKTVK